MDRYPSLTADRRSIGRQLIGLSPYQTPILLPPESRYFIENPDPFTTYGREPYLYLGDASSALPKSVRDSSASRKKDDDNKNTSNAMPASASEQAYVSTILSAVTDINIIQECQAPAGPNTLDPGTGSWTSSKKWVSEQERLRMAFHKMRSSASYNGFADSPFLPATPAEFADYKSARQQDRVRWIQKRIQAKKDDAASKKSAEQAGSGASAQLSVYKRLFAKDNRGDGLSLMLAAKTCFNEPKQPATSDEEVPWPTREEYKEERISTCPRAGYCLPVPRLNRVEPKLTVPEGAKVPRWLHEPTGAR